MDNATTGLLVLATAAVVIVLGFLMWARAEAARARSEVVRLGIENKQFATDMDSRVRARLQEWQRPN